MGQFHSKRGMLRHDRLYPKTPLACPQGWSHMLTTNTRTRSEDQRFNADESHTSYANYIFVRLVCKKKTLRQVDFRYCILDSCYLRDCEFIACDFTGCRFLSSNLRGSKFSGCNFAYTTFEKTIISDDILERECPPRENQKANFARSLRVNYQQLGEARSANKAIHVELQATKTHLYNAWHSKETYYRDKYANWARVTSSIRWSSFAVLDVLWGNGESVPKLLRSLIFFFTFMAVYHAFRVEDAGAVSSYIHGFTVAPEVFLGTRTFPQYPSSYFTIVLATRLLLFAALTSILFKRLNRR